LLGRQAFLIFANSKTKEGKMKIKTMFLYFIVLPIFIGTGLCRADAKEDPCKDAPDIIVSNVEGAVELGNDIYVTVKNLPDHIACGKDPTKFKLYLDWMKIDQVDSWLVPYKKGSKEAKLLFKVKHGDSDDAREAWAALLGRPFSKGKGIEKGVNVSVGYDKEPPVPIESKEANATLIIVRKWQLSLFVVFMVAVIGIFIWLARDTGIIRGPFPDIPHKERPFSLGRAQMAFWFFMVASSYFFIWMITGNLNTITGSVLTLVGISSATYISSAALSSDKDKEALAERQKLRKDIAALEAALQKLEKDISKKPPEAELAELEKEEEEKAAQKTKLEEKLKSKTDKLQSNGILRDLVSDASGVSLDRFQIAIWTGVLGLIFVISVFKSMAMPQFDNTLLALMGISGGTYVGFKLPGGKSEKGKKGDQQ
jgi:hypothetical protein